MLMIAATLLLPFHLHERGRDIDYSYSWPAEASAIPSLAAQLRSEQQRDRQRSAKAAASDHAGSGPATYPFHQHSFERKLRFAGQSAALASFASQTDTYSGGAHGNSVTTALLWDLRNRRATKFADLFSSLPTQLLKPQYCAGLATERKRKLGDNGDSATFPACPDPLTLAIVPTDQDHDGRFERLEVIASPYDVGSYAEGYYNITLPVTAPLMSLIKPAYRASFEIQRQ